MVTSRVWDGIKVGIVTWVGVQSCDNSGSGARSHVRPTRPRQRPGFAGVHIREDAAGQIRRGLRLPPETGITRHL
jgi:hypothetical protein